MISVDKCIPNQQISHHDNVNIIFSIKQFILHFKSFQKISKQVKTNPKPILREISKQHIAQNSFNLCCQASGIAHCHAYSYDLQVQWQFQTRHHRHNRYNQYQLLLLLLIPYRHHIGRTYHGLWPCADINFQYQGTVCCICHSQNNHHSESH